MSSGSKHTSEDKIAVTGATGMVGSHIIAELLRCGRSDIVLLVRDESRLCRLYKTLDRLGVSYSENMFTVIQTELNNPLELTEAFKDIDTVFHTAAMVSLSNDDPKQIIEVNVEITSHVVNAAMESGVRLLVHTSSIAALGGMKRGKMYINEDTELDNLATTSPYGQSKFMSENQVWRGYNMGLKVIVINPSVILGVGDWQTGASSSMIARFASGLPFYTTGAVGYVDVRDVARAQVALSQCESAIGQRFVLSAENMSFKDIISLSAQAAAKRKPIFCAGRIITTLAWRADKFISRLRGRTPQFTESIARSAQTKSYYNGGKIKKYINFDYIPIERTINEIVSAYVKDTIGK